MESTKFASGITLTVKVTDGQKIEYYNEKTKKTEIKNYVWDLTLFVVPHASGAPGYWRYVNHLPIFDVTPWAKSVIPSLIASCHFGWQVDSGQLSD